MLLSMEVEHTSNVQHCQHRVDTEDRNPVACRMPKWQQQLLVARLNTDLTGTLFEADKTA